MILYCVIKFEVYIFYERKNYYQSSWIIIIGEFFWENFLEKIDLFIIKRYLKFVIFLVQKNWSYFYASISKYSSQLEFVN